MPDTTAQPRRIGQKIWKVERMGSTYLRTPYIVTDPSCPKGRHPTRNCGCEVFKSKAKAEAYADRKNRDQS